MQNSLESEIKQSLAILTSKDAFFVPDRMSRKKWNGEWWHLVTLCEMGEAKRIPKPVAVKALRQLKTGAWPQFVITKDHAPKSKADRTMMDCCHCELGVFFQALYQCGCDVDRELPWIRQWFLKHQLPDGGLNCTPNAYCNSMKSSIVSTLPPLEAILLCTNRPFTKAEEKFLDRGARYIIEHRLVRSKGEGHIINQEWLKPLFPRFFEYDILRGMLFLTEWSKKRKKPLPAGLIEEGLTQIQEYIAEDKILLGRHVNDKNCHWRGGTFPLLKAVSQTGKISPFLSKQFQSMAPLQTND